MAELVVNVKEWEAYEFGGGTKTEETGQMRL